MRRDRSASAVAIVTYVKAGYFDETDDVVGIAHVLEHMYFKGTPSRGVGEIARETKASGGYLNAHTIYDHTSYYTVVPASRFGDALAIQADAYARSVIDAGELAKEIEVIIQEVHRKEDSPGAMASESLYALMFDRHRIRRWRIGSAEQLRTFTRDGVRSFYQNFYRPRNTILSIVGDVDPDAVLRAAESQYGALADVPAVRMPGPAGAAGARGPRAPRYREWGGDIAQTQVVLGWHTVPTLHPDSALLDLAAVILGTGRSSRLYRAVRERQLATSVSAYDYSPTELGVFVIHAECPADSAGAAARAIWAQVADLRGAGSGRPRAGAGAAAARIPLGAPDGVDGGAGVVSRRVAGARRLDTGGALPRARARRSRRAKSPAPSAATSIPTVCQRSCTVPRPVRSSPRTPTCCSQWAPRERRRPATWRPWHPGMEDTGDGERPLACAARVGASRPNGKSRACACTGPRRGSRSSSPTRPARRSRTLASSSSAGRATKARSAVGSRHSWRAVRSRARQGGQRRNSPTPSKCLAAASGRARAARTPGGRYPYRRGSRRPALRLLADVVQRAAARGGGARDRAGAGAGRARDAARRHVPVSARAS